MGGLCVNTQLNKNLITKVEFLLSEDEGGICPNCGLPRDLCVCETIAQEEAQIKVDVERRKWGRMYTILAGFDKAVDLDELSSQLKSKLACGGAAKRGHIELQGDHRGRIKDVLSDMGFPPEMIKIDWSHRSGRR
jgi:translation initiation factor 1